MKKDEDNSPSQTPDPNVQSINIDLDEATSQGIYSNLAITNFTREEFILDFAYMQPQIPKGKVRSRILLSPRNLKRLAILLQANINDYEQKFGLITEEPQLPGIKLSIN